MMGSNELDLGGDAAKIIGLLATLLFMPVILLLAAFGGLPEAAWPTGASAVIEEIPVDQLGVMQQVSLQTGIPWQLFAALAKVESDFGRNMATSEAGAIGYGQFLPETWAAYGEGGDPYDFHDVIPAMGRLLTANGAPADIPRPLYAYNHSWSYVDRVLAYAAAYGYVHPSSIPARAVELARSGIGAPVVPGAAGPDAFDTSGLVAWAYGQLGLEVPRSPDGLFGWAVPITPSQLQPGDLVFFGNAGSAVSITHVAIYAGNGSFIIAADLGDYVRQLPVSDPRWSTLFVGVGRPPYWEVSA